MRRFSMVLVAVAALVLGSSQSQAGTIDFDTAAGGSSITILLNGVIPLAQNQQAVTGSLRIGEVGS